MTLTLPIQTQTVKKIAVAVAFALIAATIFGFRKSMAPQPLRHAAAGAVGTHPGGVGIGGLTTPVAPAAGDELAAFSAGCFWGSEQAFRKMPGIVATAVGYMGGTSAFPDEALAHRTGHAETVLVEFDPKKTPYQKLLQTFWKLRTAAEPDNEATQKSPYRAEIWTYSDAEFGEAETNKLKLERQGRHKLRAKIQAAKPFYLAEDFHQQYDEKSGTEACPIAP